MAHNPGVGFEINFNARQTDALITHELYLKYSSKTFGDIEAILVKTDLAGVMADVNAQEVCAYLAWVIRMTALLTP